MSDLPERSDHRQMRVSDADRDRTAEILREATSQGRLTFEELDERLSQAYAAKTYADLAETTRDLPGPQVHAPAEVQPSAFPPARIGGTPGSKAAVAIMSGAQRSGRWVVPPVFVAVAVMGGVELDLRHAQFSQREVTIQAYTVMGGISIIAGEDVELDVSGFGFMGGFDQTASGTPGAPGAPRVCVTGFAFMGGVEVRRKPASRGIEGDQRPQITG